ncbi:MAG: preprotein translocase subunit YajC [Armatimonadota bacterium]
MQPPTTGLMQILPLVAFMLIMLVMFYYTLIRPAKQRQKSHQDLVDALKEGEEVITAGGVYGKITKLRDNWIELEVAPGVRLKFDRRAIRRRAGSDE